MFAPPPSMNLMVLRSPDIDRASSFYLEIGLAMSKHSHGNGPEHYSSSVNGFVLEIYPQRSPTDTTTNVRLGFRVADVEGLAAIVEEIGGEILSPPRETEWGRRCVVRDFDGHVIELVTPPANQAGDQQADG